MCPSTVWGAGRERSNRVRHRCLRAAGFVRPCFVCEIVACPDDPHVIWEDERYIAFLSAYPTLPGYLLVSPKRHLVDVVRDLDVESYLDMQRVVHRVASAAATVMLTERVYLMSLGSMQGNAHMACGMPANPYRRQRFHALMGENGIVNQTEREKADLADRLRAAIVATA